MLLFIARFFFFNLYESPKVLLALGRQEDAVAVVQAVAKKNHKTTWLTSEVLDAVAGTGEIAGTKDGLAKTEIIRRQLQTFAGHRLKPLFKDWKTTRSTLLIWFIWICIGMAYPLFFAFLPQYLQNAGKPEAPTSDYIVYRNYAITSVIGVPSTVIAYWTVDWKYVGRRGTLAVCTLMSGVFVYAFTHSGESAYQLGFSCLEAFFQVSIGTTAAFRCSCTNEPRTPCTLSYMRTLLSSSRRHIVALAWLPYVP
jgi:hypothetical protein